MIKDNIKNIDNYQLILNKEIIQLLKKISRNDEFKLTEKCKLFEYTYGEKVDENIFECHYKHIDYQFILEGSEYIYYTDLSQCQSISEINTEDDFQLFSSTEYSKVLLSKGDFIVFFAGEIHSPKHCFKDKVVKRLVIKEEIKND